MNYPYRAAAMYHRVSQGTHYPSGVGLKTIAIFHSGKVNVPMTTTNSLFPPGIYDSLLDHSLQQILTESPDLLAVLAKIDTEEQPSRYAAFVAELLEQALREESAPENRLALCNRIIEILSDKSEPSDQVSRKLVADRKSLLLEITPPHYGRSGIPRPQTSLVPYSKGSVITNKKIL